MFFQSCFSFGTGYLPLLLTNDIRRRLYEHELDSRTIKRHFAGKYNCIYLVFWERFQWIQHAIAREKEIKGWLRQKKINLITSFNPNWDFLNRDFE